MQLLRRVQPSGMSEENIRTLRSVCKKMMDEISKIQRNTIKKKRRQELSSVRSDSKKKALEEEVGHDHYIWGP